jgi:hypothetical protein
VTKYYTGWVRIEVEFEVGDDWAEQDGVSQALEVEQCFNAAVARAFDCGDIESYTYKEV